MKTNWPKLLGAVVIGALAVFIAGKILIFAAPFLRWVIAFCLAGYLIHKIPNKIMGIILAIVGFFLLQLVAGWLLGIGVALFKLLVFILAAAWGYDFIGDMSKKYASS